MKYIFKIRYLMLLFAFFAIQKGYAQQLPQFSQYIFNGLHINPGYAGYKGQPYIQSTYRDQWVGFPGAPKTFTLTADMSANEETMGFGISLLSDQLGPVQTNVGMLSYAYRIQTGRESFLGLGVSAGASEYALDGNMLKPGDPDDPNIPEGRVNMFTPNMNAGLFFHTERFYAGFSTFNLVGRGALRREDIALAFHDFHFYLTAGLLVPLSRSIEFKPSFLIKEVKGAPTSYDLNAMFLFNERIWLGGSYRSNVQVGMDHLQDNLNQRNAVALIMELFATRNLRIGYAFDHSMNVLNSYGNNSHEISIGYYIPSRSVVMRNPRWF
ncbi:type IX secretion system membrane protein PorP/SprF [Belliella kenyensis]|uniref:Type IX secretion system membrane protein PorP/SprF n=1 Tax=Belliella kenyensis TaxID=1472724 RepID=A0ABV8EPZ1_9BACT|nr:type IX secretion system membrane protein PorP/SprF [Belliella kenyensis]MCH7401465.1 type IX secretion system membrane protein PorP/SprF [Belliella kenyensis]MDN3603254.1 type IX secretion system membrane protein PorP/SprF [Belliella kenyensis]